MKTIRRTRTFLVLLVALAIAISPIIAKGAVEVAVPTAAVSFTDSRGVTIELSSIPQRIVSLSPNVTETLFALGIGDRVVGRTDYCDYPMEASDVPSMGDLFSPSLEKILSMNPDLVIISTLGQSQTITAIAATGVPIAFIDGSEDIEGTYHVIESIGIITGTEAEAQTMLVSMRNEIQAISTKIAGQKTPSVYYVAGFGEWGDFTATGDTFIHDLITLAGGENIAKDAVNWTFQLELLVEADPDIIILPPSWGSTFEETKMQFSSIAGYRDLSAVRSGNLFTFDNAMIERQGPRSAQAVTNLAAIFHPDLISPSKR
jgi:iron complex transport system substrate-binding protein